MKRILTIAVLAIGMFASAQDTSINVIANKDKTFAIDITNQHQNFIYGVGVGSNRQTEQGEGIIYVNVGKEVNNTFAYSLKVGTTTGDYRTLYGGSVYLRYTKRIQAVISYDNINKTMAGVGIRF
jgi:hypothetical protein